MFNFVIYSSNIFNKNCRMLFTISARPREKAGFLVESATLSSQKKPWAFNQDFMVPKSPVGMAHISTFAGRHFVNDVSLVCILTYIMSADRVK